MKKFRTKPGVEVQIDVSDKADAITVNREMFDTVFEAVLDVYESERIAELEKENANISTERDSKIGDLAFQQARYDKLWKLAESNAIAVGYLNRRVERLQDENARLRAAHEDKPGTITRPDVFQGDCGCQLAIVPAYDNEDVELRPCNSHAEPGHTTVLVGAGFVANILRDMRANTSRIREERDEARRKLNLFWHRGTQ